MLNRYRGFCSRCGFEVQAGGGVADRIDGKWIVRHDYCADLDRTSARYAAVRPTEAQADTAAR
jgi:hypothetical protein